MYVNCESLTMFLQFVPNLSSLKKTQNNNNNNNMIRDLASLKQGGVFTLRIPPRPSYNRLTWLWGSIQRQRFNISIPPFHEYGAPAFSRDGLIRRECSKENIIVTLMLLAYAFITRICQTFLHFLLLGHNPVISFHRKI